VIVQIARNLCLDHPSARKTNDSPLQEEQLSEDIDQLFELTRIIVLVLAGLVPNLTENKPQMLQQQALNDEAVSLLSLSLSALVDAADVFPTVIRTDLHACLIHAFATILGTSSCQAGAVPQALPILKRFLTTLARSPQQETAIQLRGALARFLNTLKVAQRREDGAEVSVACEKNAMLASTILITSTSNVFAAGDPLLKRFVDELLEALESRVPSKVAASCCRSLLLLPVKTQTDEAVKAYLLPKLLTFVSNPPEAEGTTESRTMVAHALTTFVSTLPLAKIVSAMGLIVTALLVRAQKEGHLLYGETAARLLELAAADQSSFRGMVGRMEPDVKAFMEEILRAGGAGRKQEVVKDDTGEPSIALKMDFGS